MRTRLQTLVAAAVKRRPIKFHKVPPLHSDSYGMSYGLKVCKSSPPNPFS